MVTQVRTGSVTNFVQSLTEAARASHVDVELPLGTLEATHDLDSELTGLRAEVIKLRNENKSLSHAVAAAHVLYMEVGNMPGSASASEKLYAAYDRLDAIFSK